MKRIGDMLDIAQIKRVRFVVKNSSLTPTATVAEGKEILKRYMDSKAFKIQVKEKELAMLRARSSEGLK